MFGRSAHIKLVAALMSTTVTLLAGSASAQSSLNPSGDLKSELDTLKAENAVVRELLRKMEEQQKALLEQVDRLSRRLDGVPAAVDELPASGPSEAISPQQPTDKPQKEDR